MKKNRGTGFYAKKTAGIIFIVFLLGISLYPFVWMILNSFKSNMEIFKQTFSLPENWDFSIFRKAWEFGEFSGALSISALVTGSVVVCTLFVSSMAAFATSHLEFRGRSLFLNAFVGLQVVSGQMLLISIFRLLQNIRLFNTRTGLILTCISFSIPFSAYIMHSFFGGIPHELYESAQIDGCPDFLYFTKILVPLSKPVFASVAIFVAMSTWNEFLFAMTFLRKERTLTVQLQTFFSSYSGDYNIAFAGLTIAVLPVLLIYLCMQKYFIKGLTSGAVKG